jgi:hypothetical protein
MLHRLCPSETGFNASCTNIRRPTKPLGRPPTTPARLPGRDHRRRSFQQGCSGRRWVTASNGRRSGPGDPGDRGGERGLLRAFRCRPLSFPSGRRDDQVDSLFLRCRANIDCEGAGHLRRPRGEARARRCREGHSNSLWLLETPGAGSAGCPQSAVARCPKASGAVRGPRAHPTWET